MSARIIVSVTNDLVSDQRVHKVCLTLQEIGLDVLLVGRRLKGSEEVQRSYQTYRMKLLFNSGPLFMQNLISAYYGFCSRNILCC